MLNISKLNVELPSILVRYMYARATDLIKFEYIQGEANFLFHYDF
jgi:hypothetical protein